MADKIQWTKPQHQAIKARTSNVLVTASAGTGKTAVLSARCIDILKENKCTILDFLVLTFTDLAAEEMRSRISQELSKAYTQTGDKNLRTQMVLLQGADISTIHSFCKKLITEYFYHLDLDPGFGIIEPDEQKLIKADALEKTIEWAWSQPHLFAAMETLLKGRDFRPDKGFLSNIISISQFLDNQPDRDQWFDSLADTKKIAQAQKKLIAEKLDLILSQLLAARRLCCEQDCEHDWLDKLSEKLIEPLENLKSAFDNKTWQNFAAAVTQFSWPRKITLKTASDSAIDVYDSLIDSAKENFKKITSFAVLNPDYTAAIGSSADLQTKVLAQMVQKFDELYKLAKRNINCLDFPDLEHLALKILTQKSDVAKTLRQKYKHIFVDEYQDINPVQQAIIDAVSSGDNVFVVGDVKQSIYAFRGAEPGIFLSKLDHVTSQKAPGIKIDLNENFRSKEKILNLANTVFEKIITPQTCMIDYDAAAKLTPGTDQQKTSGPPAAELHILDEQSLPDDELSLDPDALTPSKRQAALIARRINQIVNPKDPRPEFEIFDKTTGKFRPAQFRDIVILMRSPSKKAADYVEILRLAGIGVSTLSAGGYFQAVEIADCISLLKVLDNRQRDIELASVLRSPFFSISDSDLTRIKLFDRDTPQRLGFYGAVMRYCQSGPDEKLKSRLNEIMDQLEKWSLAGKADTLSNLIWEIYRETGYLSFVSALPGSAARRANLLKLHDLAIQFSGFNTKSGSGCLARFVEFVEKVQDSEQNWSQAKPENSAENNVRIMSVHAAKGLEFPIVFLAQLDTAFNTSDTSGDLLIDSEETIGLKIFDPETANKITTIAHEVIAEKKKALSIAEELRILYVALTRPRDRLILTANAKKDKCRQAVSKGSYFSADNAHWAICNAKTSLEWILHGLCRQQNLKNALDVPPSGCPEEDLVNVSLYDETGLNDLSNFLKRLKTPAKQADPPDTEKPDPQLFTKVQQALNWKYPFDSASNIRAKNSVTNLTHQLDEFAQIDYSDAIDLLPKALAESSSKIDSASIGTAAHLVITNIDLNKPIDLAALEQTMQNLISSGQITPQTARHIDLSSILAFFQSDLGKQVLTAPDIRREWQFSFGLNISEFTQTPQPGNQVVVVQGSIDLLAQTQQKYIIIDFKTDRISPDQAQNRALRYKNQVRLYSQAVKSVTGTGKPIEKWIYFLEPRSAVEI